MDDLGEKRLWVSTWLCGHSPFLGVSVRIWTWGALVRGIAHPQVTMATHSHHSGLIYVPPLFMPNSVSGTVRHNMRTWSLSRRSPWLGGQPVMPFQEDAEWRARDSTGPHALRQ